jgi:uncharacterized membrane protein YjgN (DUF898 family)
MSVTEIGQRTSPVQFTGTRGELFGLLFRGYLAMIPTIGLYRFWVTTWKRRYYWQHTIIHGQPLEYTGSATQLLIGFLIALGIFLPIYGGFFYLSTQTSDVVLWGYLVVAIAFWFAQGYAIYRARDFRLSRTLWRGIRFDQKGSALRYALRRFFWSLLVAVTFGLAYPFMASSLWRYRYGHSWYGDRQFSWIGSWKTIAGPYYIAWLIVVVLIVATALIVPADLHSSGDMLYPGPLAIAVSLAASAGILLSWLYFRAREATRMFSAIRVGDAALAVKVRMRTLLGQGLLYALCGTGALIIFGGFFLGFAFSITGGAGGDPQDLARIAQSSILNVSILLAGYLFFLGALGLFGEIFLGLGFWMTVARGTTLINPDSLDTVRATAEDRAIAGEGLADALNVGAY